MTRYRRPHRSLRRGGFSLLEVAVALVIFVIGAMSILRVFPPALGLIADSGDRIAAISLNRGALAQLSRSVPDAVYEADTAWVGSVVGTAIRNNSLPSAPLSDPIDAAFNYSALGRFHNIVGESHTVQTTDVGDVPYVLTQYPYAEAGVTADQPLVYQDAAVTGVTVTDAQGDLDFSHASYGSSPSIPAGYPSTGYSLFSYTNGYTVGDTIFYVTYHWSLNGYLQGVVDEPIGASSTSTVQLLQGQRVGRPLPAAVMVTGPVQVRMRRLIANGSGSGGEPETGLIDLSSPTVKNLSGQELQATDQVSVSYVVSDWRWLMTNSSGSGGNGTTFSVVLPVPHLDDTLTNVAFALTDNSTGNLPTQSALTLATSGAAGTVVAKTGVASFAQPTPATVALPQVRVAYRTLNDWTNQISVAARSYKPYYSSYSTAPTEDYRDYYWPRSSTSYTSPSNVIYFKPTEAGKSVLVSYSYNSGASTATDKLFTIDEDMVTSPAGVDTSFLVNNKASSLELTDANGAQLGVNDVVGVTSVRGASMQSRTAWVSGSRFLQNSATLYRGNG